MNRFPKNHWVDLSNQKKFLDEIAEKLNFKSPLDWGKVSLDQINKAGGAGILNRYGGSLLKTVKTVYPSINWENNIFENTPQGFWKDKKNQKKFVDDLAKQLNILSYKDWTNVTRKDFIRHGGRGLLKYFDSTKKVLQTVYPDVNWNSFHFPHMQRRFLDELARKLEIRTNEDWGNITVEKVNENGGRGLMLMYNDSLYEALKATYPEVHWNVSEFKNIQKVPRNHWKKLENQREFFRTLARDFKIKEPRKWGLVSNSQVVERGGGGLLQIYGGSLRFALKTIFPDIKWKREWFKNAPMFPRNYFGNIENRKTFLDDIKTNYHLQTIDDWRKISLNFIRRKGGHGLLEKYGNSLVRALQAVYPEVQWDFEETSVVAKQHKQLTSKIGFYPLNIVLTTRQ